MIERANVMIRIARLMGSLSTNDERRAVAFDVWQTYGGSLEELKRRIERERKFSRRSQETSANVPLFDGKNGDGGFPPTPPFTQPTVCFQIPESIRMALSKSSYLGTAEMLRRPSFWQAEIRANPGADYAKEILKAEAWVQSHWDERPRKRAGQFLHRWLSRAERAE